MIKQLPVTRLLAVLLAGTCSTPEADAFPSGSDTSRSAIHQPGDSLSGAGRFLRSGHLSVRGRLYWMNTNNRQGLSDYYALGMGAGVGYRTARLVKHIELGGSVFFSKNLFSSNLAALDPATGLGNRYEAGLFNVQDPASRAVLSRLEELYATYQFGRKSRVVLGRQLPHSPFLNPADGRLSPTFVEGLIAEWKESDNTQIQVEYLTRIAPRSTIGWYGVGESIGLYPVGIDVTGKPAQYGGNTRSASVIQVGVTQKAGHATLQLWDTRVQNVFNLLYARADLVWPTAEQRQWTAGVQVARQWTIGNGGNPDPAKAYAPPGNRSLVLSGRVGYQTPRWAAYANATRITAEGRFLFPREWGREPFYTFLMRERNEGFGDLTAVSANVFFTPTPRLKIETSLGLYGLPDVKNYALNKYGMPAYRQINLNLTYRLKGSLSGFDTQVLLVHKGAVGTTYDNDRYVLNKVDMNQLYVILNYKL
ncbi:OprD family outer membrane porin [Spirosoma spitsbergense]|jgi:hypothetical protein|uniref:OprD family outer membrane porin n=1 Tax=Spirosoma spitsbergense TaxID=431554 RepID=UPI0003607961|nr:OprD family outer membrane porin [Spirosoma spitsbergense]